MKKLSIIIPVYNVEKYLDRCLNSILKNKKNIETEIILVDDGSTDNSPSICDNYQEKYENIICYHKKNGGASDARNYGIKKSKSEYIWFVDSDDTITDNSITEFLDIIDNNNPDVIICKSKVVDEKNNVFDECKYSIERGSYTSKEFMNILKKNPKSVIFCPQYYLVKRDFIIDNNLFFYKGIIYEDELWIPQLLIKANKIFYSNCNTYFHYMIETSVMHSTKLEKCGKSDYIVSSELMRIYNESGREDLEFLRDRCVNIFLQSVWKIPTYFEENDRQRKMPIKNAYYLKTKIKSLLYFISPKLYLIIHNFFNRER